MAGLDGLEFYGCKGIERPIRVAAYARVSTDSEDQEESFKTQVKFFKEALKDHPGWVSAGVYGDRGRTGTSTDGRAEFNAMIKHAKEGDMDYIVAKSISRFSRSVVDTLTHLRDLAGIGVGVYFMEQGFDSLSPGSEFILTTLSSIAEMESESTSENIKMVFDAKNAKGTPARKCCYGYEKKGSDWVVDEKKAARVKLGFLMAASGYSFAEISKRLNQFEEVDRSGRIWERKMVRRMLTNECYTGDITTNKTYSARTEKGHRQLPNDGMVDRYNIEGHHDPLVGRELFDKVGEMVRARELAGQENFKGVDGVRLLARKDRLLNDVRRFVPGKPGRWMVKYGFE